MTTQRAQELLDASMELTLRPQKDDRKKLIAFIINEAAARLCTDWAEGQMPQDVLYELANEVENLKMTDRLQFKQTEKYYGDFEGSFESIISQLQSELDAGWEGIEIEYECNRSKYYLYKFRTETDLEYGKRMNLLDEAEKEELKAKEERRKEYEKLRKEFENT